MATILSLEDAKLVEKLVDNYKGKCGSVAPIVRASMLMSFRQGVLETLKMLQEKAEANRIEREHKETFLTED